VFKIFRQTALINYRLRHFWNQPTISDQKRVFLSFSSLELGVTIVVAAILLSFDATVVVQATLLSANIFFASPRWPTKILIRNKSAADSFILFGDVDCAGTCAATRRVVLCMLFRPCYLFYRNSIHCFWFFFPFLFEGSSFKLADITNKCLSKRLGRRRAVPKFGRLLFLDRFLFLFGCFGVFFLFLLLFILCSCFWFWFVCLGSSGGRRFLLLFDCFGIFFLVRRRIFFRFIQDTRYK